MGTANVRRLGWLVCAVGLVAGCGGGPQNSADLRDLEPLGLVTDQGYEAYRDSLYAIFRRAGEGDVEGLETLLRVGMFGDLSWVVQYFENNRRNFNSAHFDQVIEILQAADPVAAGRQANLEARNLAMSEAASDLPENYHWVMRYSCGWLPVLFMGPCIENNIDVVVQFFEPDGPRRQFGIWLQDDRRNPTRGDHIVISDASGGALLCDGLGADSFGGTWKWGGAFTDDGVLTDGRYTYVVHERNGVEFLTGGGRSYMRVTEPSLAAFEAYELCLGP